MAGFPFQPDRSMKATRLAAFPLPYVLALLCAAMPAQSSGAIYTTNKNAAVLNGNLFRKKIDVYLAGGVGASAPCSSPGLPDGHYYFQVTSPSGDVLLSEDVIQDREVVVTQDPIWWGGAYGYRSWYGYYWGMAYPVRTDVRAYNVYVAQTSLTDLSSDRIEWAARTRTTEASNIQREVRAFVDVILEAMVKAGLVAAGG